MLRKIETKKVKPISDKEMNHVLGSADCPIACSCNNCGDSDTSKYIFIANQSDSCLIEPTA